MLDDVYYFNFEEKEDLINRFFKCIFKYEKYSEILSILDGYLEFYGNARNEEIGIYFSSEFSKDDEEYFGENKVAFYYWYPAEDKDMIVILTYEEFYNSLLKNYELYEDNFSNNENLIIKDKLNILKNKLEI